jgi:hypothetical protein
MDDVTVALAIHVMAVVLWIGGVAMVTTVLLSAIRRFKSAEERTAFFEKIERRFARQARGTILFAGADPGRSVDRACLYCSFSPPFYQARFPNLRERAPIISAAMRGTKRMIEGWTQAGAGNTGIAGHGNSRASGSVFWDAYSI